jgi:hypothetical protein
MDEVTTAVSGASDWWSAFSAQLLATIAGAAIALFGSWLLFRLESRERGSAEMDGAIAKAIDECVKYLRALQPVTKDLQQDTDVAAYRIEALPSAYPIEARLRSAVVVSDGYARKALYVAVQIAASIDVQPNPLSRESFTKELRELLYEWRGARTIDDKAALAKAIEIRSFFTHSAEEETNL